MPSSWRQVAHANRFTEAEISRDRRVVTHPCSREPSGCIDPLIDTLRSRLDEKSREIYVQIFKYINIFNAIWGWQRSSIAGASPLSFDRSIDEQFS